MPSIAEIELKHKESAGENVCPATGSVSRNSAHHLDRSRKFCAANVTGPEVVDSAGKMEAGLLGHQQRAAAMRAIRSLEPTFVRMDELRPGETRGIGHHLGSSSLHPSPIHCIPHRTLAASRMSGWRDGSMKVLWLSRGSAEEGGARRTALNKSTNWCRWARNWSGLKARSPRFSDLHRVRALRSSRSRTAQRRRRAQPTRRGGWYFPDQSHASRSRPPRSSRKSFEYLAIMVSPQVAGNSVGSAGNRREAQLCPNFM